VFNASKDSVQVNIIVEMFIWSRTLLLVYGPGLIRCFIDVFTYQTGTVLDITIKINV
jgi:hypothetical protein